MLLNQSLWWWTKVIQSNQTRRTLRKLKTLHSSWYGVDVTDERVTYLLFGITVAAHGPQVFEGPPQEDDEETPEESHHGGCEESPPHPLTVAVTRHIRWEGDNYIHLGYVDRRVGVEFLSALGHHGLWISCLPPERTLQSSASQAQRGVPASVPWCHRCAAMSSGLSPSPLVSLDNGVTMSGQQMTVCVRVCGGCGGETSFEMQIQSCALYDAPSLAALARYFQCSRNNNK